MKTAIYRENLFVFLRGIFQQSLLIST